MAPDVKRLAAQYQKEVCPTKATRHDPSWVKALHEHSADALSAAITAFAAACKRDGTDREYRPGVRSFIDSGTYLDYLPGAKPATPPPEDGRAAALRAHYETIEARKRAATRKYTPGVLHA